MLFKFFHKGIGLFKFIRKNEEHYKNDFIEGCAIYSTDVFHGKLTVQNIHSELYGISYRIFDYYKKADINVEEIPDCLRIEYVYRGKACIRKQDDEPQDLQIGNYVITKSREYVFQSCEKEGAEIFIFYFPIVEKSIPEVKSLITNTVYYSTPSMSDSIRKLFKHDYSADTFPLHYFCTLQAFLMDHINSQLSRSEAIETKQSRYYHHVMKIAEIIRSNLQKHYTNEELSRMAGVNKTTMQIEFKNIHKMTIKKYLTKHRMECVKHLLSHTMKNLDEIAALSGYCGASHLSCAFTTENNITPMEWRKLNFGTYGTNNN